MPVELKTLAGFCFGRCVSFSSMAGQRLDSILCLFLSFCQQTSDRGTVLVRCWSTVIDGGPAFNREVMITRACFVCMWPRKHETLTRCLFCVAGPPLSRHRVGVSCWPDVVPALGGCFILIWMMMGIIVPHIRRIDLVLI